ncbi:MAG: MFS transporter [Stackebrandtia sp.]
MSASPSRAGTAAVVTTVASVCPVFLVGGLSVQIAADLRFSAFQLGLAVALYFTAAAVSGVGCGFVVERLGARLSGRIAIAVAASALLGIAAAGSYTALALLLTAAGPANTLGQLAANALLSRRVPRRRQGLMFGVKQAAIPLSTTLAGASVPVVALTVGWRWAFVLAAVLAMAAWPTLPRIHVETATRRSRAQASRQRPSAALVAVAVAGAMGATAANPLGSFLADYAVTQGLSESAAGLNLTLGGVAGVAARVGVGWIADRRDGGRLVMVAIMLGSGAVGMAMLATGGAWLIPVGTAVGFALGWAWPGLVNFAISSLHPHAPAAATGVTQTGIALGGGLGPLAFGAIVETSGYTTAWLSTAGLMLASAVMMIVGRRMLLASRRRPSPG